MKGGYEGDSVLNNNGTPQTGAHERGEPPKTQQRVA